MRPDYRSQVQVGEPVVFEPELAADVVVAIGGAEAVVAGLDLPVVALSQVKRETEGKRPSLADLRESGSIEQDADVVMFLHRERQSDKFADETTNDVETELIIAKQRNGPVGTLKIAFLPEFTRFEQLSKEKAQA